MSSFAVKPFCATYYNPLGTKNYSDVICPPYDVISKKQLSFLRKKSPYNFSHVLIADKRNYQEKGVLLNEWVKKGVLIDDSQESYYLYEQKFNVEGKQFTRFGLLSLLQMNKKGIFPHEHTLTAPKKDRKRIIKATKANLSPIFIIATKRLDEFAKIYKIYSKKKPLFKFKDIDNNRSRVWKISDKKEITKLGKVMNKCKLVIADGHHRFEITYDYFKKNKSRFKDLNYILAYVTDCQKGLNIMPTHRVVTIEDKDKEFFGKLNKYFKVGKVTQSGLKEKLGSYSGFNLGICKKGQCYFMSLKNRATLNKIPNKLYRELDTYLLHQLVLPLFKRKGAIEYTHSLGEAKKLASKKKVAFILRAVSLDAVFKISSRGFRLPQKSTYFYPKVASGVTIRRFKP
ncbi:MAG: DUF1015 domain-containing protein [Candidatus Omnitrophica bacterium]|nr:DUF1015 domain-containing protein [Candidatus Omnitrophota bacterium]